MEVWNIRGWASDGNQSKLTQHLHETGPNPPGSLAVPAIVIKQIRQGALVYYYKIV